MNHRIFSRRPIGITLLGVLFFSIAGPLSSVPEVQAASASATARLVKKLKKQIKILKAQLAIARQPAPVTPAAPVIPFGFRSIPGGSFTMGATSGDTDADAPPTSVTVSLFYMAEMETTKAEWDEVRTWGAGNGYSDLAAGEGKGPAHPVQTVTWFDVVKWCNARSEKEGLTPCYRVAGNVMRTGTSDPTVDWQVNGYRLPTEAEWEKAARGGVAGKRFPWGSDTISHVEANYNNSNGEPYASGTLSLHPIYATGVSPHTSQAGSFGWNGYGLKDMAGNVFEWCWDAHDSNYYGTDLTDPRGPATGFSRVQRGGSWGGPASAARASNRAFNGSPISHGTVGFRTARSVLP